MNPKTTMGLVIALVLAVLGVWWAQSSSQQDQTPQASGSENLFELASPDVKGFEIKIGDAAACAFVKEDNVWRMTAPIAGPGEQAAINADASTVANLKHVKSYGPDDPERPTEEMTSLANPSRIVKLTVKDDKTYVLKIGARQKLSRKTYVQKEGDETIYLVDADLNRDLRRSLTDYRGKQVCRFTVSEAVRLEVSGIQNYTAVKKDGKWTIEAPLKARADLSAVNQVLNAVSNLRVEKFVADQPKSLRPYGLDDARLKITVTTEKKTPKPSEGPPASQPAVPEYDIESKTIRVAFGGSAEENVFAKLDEAGSPAVFQVAKTALEQAGKPMSELRDKKVANLDTRRAQRIKIASGADLVELVKEGTVWKIVSGIEGMASDIAEFAAVDDLLKALRDLKAVGFESDPSPGHGLETPRTTIEVAVEGQVEPLRIAVGGFSPSRTSVYVKNESENFIAAVSTGDAETLAVKPIAFLSREILTFPRNRVSRIEGLRPNGPFTVERQNNVWRFTSPVQGKTQAAAIDNILSDLATLRGRRVVARPQSAASFGLDQPTIRATITVDPPPKPSPTTQPAEGDENAQPSPEPPASYTVLVSRRGDKVYAMRADGATICEIDEKVLADLEAELLDTQVLSLEPSLAVKLAFSRPEAFTFIKFGDDWSLEGESSFPTDPTKITETLEAMRDLRAKRYVQYAGGDPAGYGLDVPALEIGVQTEEGDTLTLRIAASGPSDEEWYASLSTFAGRIFVIDAKDREKLEKQVKDFRNAG